MEIYGDMDRDTSISCAIPLRCYGFFSFGYECDGIVVSLLTLVPTLG